MSWQERFSSRMNRSSWKTAHEDTTQGELCPGCKQSFPHKEDCFLKHYLNTPERLNKAVQITREKQPDFWETKMNDSDMSPGYWENKFKNSMKRFADSDSLTLRGEGAPAFTEPTYGDDQEEESVGPQDLDSNATRVDKFPKSVGVFKNSSWNTRIADSGGDGSAFGNPIDENINRMQSVESPGLDIRTPLDTGQRNYSEQRQNANPLTLRSWFTGDDVNGPWPHTKNLSGPLDFDPRDDQNKDSAGPVMGSSNSRYAHDDYHPWPDSDYEATEHLVSGHHEPFVSFIMNRLGQTHEDAVYSIRNAKSFRKRDGGTLTPADAHITLHKEKTHGKPQHEHNDDFDIDVPDNIETITPTYITSSWHEAFVETFDTHPDQESPDTLLNPADELKNGRPRANDLPQQSAQLLPGMLIDHDQMGGSGTDSGSF